MVAAVSVLPESADSTDQFIANFMLHLNGLPPATEDAAVKPQEAPAAKAEAKRNAQVSSVGFCLALLMTSCMSGTKNSLCLYFEYIHISRKHGPLQQMHTSEVVSITGR